MGNEEKIWKENLISKIGIALIFAILIIVCIIASLRFDSVTTVFKAIDDSNCVKVDYSGLDSQLVITKSNDEQVKFKMTEESFVSLSLRLMRERGWVFESRKIPAGEGYEAYKVYHGTRKPEQ